MASRKRHNRGRRTEIVRLRVLIACERSAIVRDAFRARGHDAWSCDLAECEGDPTYHLQCDVRTVLANGWDLMIAHPDCTYITNSGVQWLWNVPRKPKPGVLYGPPRWEALDRACGFFKELLNAPIPKIGAENPIPHKYAIERIGRTYDQRIQPYDFGHGETKATCLWLKNLPPLISTLRVQEREQRVFKEPPGPNRWINRSRTYQGIADAMAEQWGRS